MRQRDVPGIDSAFLAMDTEEGVEVVWNEVQISENKASKSQLVRVSSSPHYTTGSSQERGDRGLTNIRQCLGGHLIYL